MAIVTIPDVLAALAHHWQGDRTLAELVPGGLHHGRVPITLAGKVRAPYGRVAVHEGTPQWNSSASHIQVFTLQLSIWSEGGNVDAGRILGSVDRRFDRGSARKTWYLPAADGIIDLRPLPGTFELDDVTREAKDQAVGQRQWELWVQATHGRG